VTSTTTAAMTNNLWLTATSTTYLLHRRQATPIGPFQLANRSINMIVGGLKSHVSRRCYCKDKREVHLIHT
jgi:hypothetical protein